ncbi:unnamed protein product [Rotaria sp. Silwood1]|nr:unnamed protein product [Rotaria sp. Silwood1]CAF3863538.1 unnamed protein product [Rotaria sp. Silwood1]CAF4715865.1 unnamed protein product [Rotaria sp. Silwood1]
MFYVYILATYTVLYSEADPSALAKYRLWKSVGFVVTYGYSSYVTIRLSLILLLVYLSVSMLGYGLVEVHLRWKDYQKKKRTVIDSA